MTINEAIEYLRIPRSSLYKLAQEGKVPAQKVGRHWRFHRDVLEEWLKRGMRAGDRRKGVRDRRIRFRKPPPDDS